MEDPEIRTYDHIDFLPKQIAPANVYNSFKYFEASIKDLVSDIDIHDTCLMKHISVLCNNHEPTIKYFLDCLANMVQHPYQLTNTAILMKSKQGAGKDSFFDYFGHKILGSKYYTTQDSAELIFGRFNTELEDKVLVVLNEASGKETYTINSKIKNAITRKTNTIEGKGLKPYDNQNNIFYVFLTNSSNALKIEESDRRFVCIECDSSKANDKTYFNDLFKELNSGTIDRLFYDYLMNRDITKTNFTLDRPTTDLYKNMQSVNIPIEGRFLCSIVDDINERNIVKGASELFQQFSDWTIINKLKNETSSTKFGINLKDYSSITKKRAVSGMKYVIDIQALKQDLI